MKPVFKRARKDGPPESNLLQRLLNWIFDKDNFAFLTKSASIVGGAFVAIFYLTIKQNPAIGAGQLPLLFSQALLVGGVIVVYLAYVLAAPSWAIPFLGIKIEHVPEDRRQRFLAKFAMRNFTAQLFSASAIVIWVTSPFTSDHPLPIVWAVASEVFMFLGLSLCFMERNRAYGLAEREIEYWLSNLMIGALGLLALYGLTLLYATTPEAKRVGDAQALATWFAVMLVSSVMSGIDKNQSQVKFLAPFIVLFLVLWAFELLDLPFRLTAYAIGIAERNPVTLVLPPTTCWQVRQELSDPAKLVCDQDKAGVIHDVWLDNELGDRWAMREIDKSARIVFDGKGVVVRRDIPKQQGSDRT